MPSSVFGADSGRCIHELFQAQVDRTPDNLAVVLGSQRLTYRELNLRANQLAHFLRHQGVRPDVLVGICLERSIELVVGLLGILKAGGTYVPIDPLYPPERRAFMLQDSNSPLILTQEKLARDLVVPNSRQVLLDEDWPSISREAATNPDAAVQPDHLAYVIYTSGSTGTPKGTLISHRNVVRLFTATQPWFGFTERDVWTLFHSCAFDFSVWELWGALFHGGRLVVVPFDVSRTPDAFYRLLGEERVTVLNQTPSAFRQLIRAEETASAGVDLALRYVIFGGEALDPKSLQPWFERHGDTHPRLINMYGITETTVHVTYRPLSATDLDAPSVIGVPIPDLHLYLLDEARRPVPTGEPGEIYVGGAGVARGYLNRPELTAQKFIATPFAPDAGTLYRSGDLARYLPGGDLEYLGRIDQQVKIRGFRIELGEIAAELDRHPGVRESVVVVQEPPPGAGTPREKTLVAYIVKQPAGHRAEGSEAADVPALRQMLRQRLPDYMIPAAFVFIDGLPLTVNGKLDIKALPPPDVDPGAPPGVRPAEGTALERGIADIWREILHVNHAGLDQNFFDLGGNSIHLADVHSRLQRLLERTFSITDLFAHPTIRSLAAHFSGATDSVAAEARQTPQARAQRQREALLARRNVRHEKK
ncbi:MAG: amino acid adenylation domain-containing protein [Pseudomonadota bacterium]|nr:amino acid adenylation domain-containing protein [Pseudomonadota bacterium]